MEILKAYGVSEEIVKATEVLYVDITAQVLSPDGDTDFCNIYAGALQGDTFALYLTCLLWHWTMQCESNSDSYQLWLHVMQVQKQETSYSSQLIPTRMMT